MIEQLRPSDLNGMAYAEHEARFQLCMQRFAPRTYWRHWQLGFLPGIISDEAHQELKTATDLLLSAAVAVVRAYPTDSRIQAIFALSEPLHRLVMAAGSKPFNPHTARPDFLIDIHGKPRFCEINCRFPANGYMNSIQMTKVAQAMYQTPSPLAFTAEDLLSHDDGGLLALVQLSEIGDEIWDLVNGKPILPVHPADLRTVDGKLYVGPNRVAKVLTELDRTELQHFSDPVMRLLAEGSYLLNDMRGQILLHDKRLLAVLWREDLMSQWMDTEDYAKLRPYLIPSFRADDPDLIETMTSQPQNWILKPASGGRGRGTLVGSVAPHEAWQTAMDQGVDFVAQHWVPQKQIPLIYGAINGTLQEKTMSVVGCVPTLAGKALGVGLLRASSKHLVNVSTGGAVMFACNLTQPAS